MTTILCVTILLSVIPAKLTQIKTQHHTSKREPESRWSEMRVTLWNALATFHEIAGRARAWLSCRVKLIELPFDKLFILLARNDKLNTKYTLFLKCHRGRVNPILNTTTTLQNATRDPHEVKHTKYLWNSPVIRFMGLRVAPEPEHDTL